MAKEISAAEFHQKEVELQENTSAGVRSSSALRAA
jgi:hypothetical protein